MIYLCDFEDSFTYNIYADLLEISDVEVIPFKDVFKFLQAKSQSIQKEIIILGPGPGHPDDYSFISSSIKALLNRDNLLLVGVCLGHQLIWTSMGHECTHSATPIHGQARALDFDKDWQEFLEMEKPIQTVQFYNSLCIKLNNSQLRDYAQNKGWKFFVNNNELFISANKGLLTYQFHPESVGTSCQSGLYSPLRRFLL